MPFNNYKNGISKFELWVDYLEEAVSDSPLKVILTAFDLQFLAIFYHMLLTYACLLFRLNIIS